MRNGLRGWFLAVFLILFFPLSQGEGRDMQSDKISLPDNIDGWKLQGPPRRIDKTNIFDYMNGAGELYISYHFDCLLVYEYKNKSDNEILVELYYMRDSRDSFGLLSLDWGGEAVDLNPNHLKESEKSIIPTQQALYGEGLMRIWADNLYVRILAFRDTPGVKETILRLGKIITNSRSSPPPPKILQIIKPLQGSSWTLNKERTAYFYSHLVLNSLYYLSHENILNLDHSTEAVIVTFEKPQKDSQSSSARLFVIKYPDFRRAETALRDFFKIYLPEQGRKVKIIKSKESQEFFNIEDGWMGYKLLNQSLALVFECPDKESAQEILAQAKLDKIQKED